MEKATPKDTYDHIIGSVALAHSWWSGIETTGVEGSEASDAWKVAALIDDPEGDEGRDFKSVEFDHATLMRAIRKCAEKDRPRHVTDWCARECRAFIFNRDECDFDANTADEVLQVAALGEVVYG